ncbi:receptor [Fulvivirga sp. RKSG066]|uniref:7TM diverse intracellular signaling domain-containing protein n=1 Tax=Fulvivirga aurantia TaxID=2529383 RepID=UPI0012BBEBC3|nr:7TM diverse intracellular signaling domain-containing protein [Fulvivirga aurantia]MTI22937.1 receptor [Fulvivirga aurantia]
MNSIKTALFIVIYLLVWTPFFGQSLPNNATDEVILDIISLEIYEDVDGSKEFEDVLTGNLNFKKQVRFETKDYNTDSYYWVKLPLDLNKNNNKQWLIEFYDQTIDHIEAYLPQPNGRYDTLIMGDQYPFLQKTLRHKNFEIFIDPFLEGRQTYYFRIKSHTYADIRIAVRSVNRFVQYSLFEYFLYGIFYGTILIISLYNILIYLAIREVKYLYYTFYIFSVGLYAMCVDGMAYQYLWPNQPEWNQIAHGTALFLVIFWALLFGQRFLNTRVRARKIYKAITAIVILRTLLFVYALLFDHSLFEWRNIEIIPMLLIFYAGIDVLARGYKPARFFVVAYGVLFLGFLIKALLNWSIIPFYILSYYSLHICFLLEMLLLTYALSDRVRILKSNRDRALKRIIIQHQQNVELKDKVNQELEQLVTQRTKELQEKNLLLNETNKKLYLQTNEISKINSILDLDNWKLKNNIKEILQDRLINKNLTIDEFKEIFPNDISCYRFLDRLKWSEGFECSKCGNTKYSDGHTKFSRRCSKCGYDESVTSNTIFHRIKFPIEKAFYILYVVNDKQHKYTLDDLSELLDLRRNTVWNFRKKIEKVFMENEGTRFKITDLFTAHLEKKG